MCEILPKCVKFACNYFKNVFSFWGTSSPDPLPGLRPWTSLGPVLFCPPPHPIFGLYVCLLPINSARLRSTPRMVDIRNQNDPGSALIRSSFALTVCWEIPLWLKLRNQIQNRQSEVSSVHVHAVKADKGGNWNWK